MYSNYPYWNPELVFNAQPFITSSNFPYHNLVVAGGKRWLAPENVTLDMVREQWTSPFTKKQSVSYIKVPASNGKTFYDVLVVDGVKTQCNCIAGQYNRPCKHLK